ncbi:flippase-like domain-containing protein [Saliphagus sp. LR7]|uniref:flippase-like domain-containing protein n=1 Tax=Saliphagus sp. LR7 TaxID=2282654 RepID=UPI000DF7F746|nr:flippase-like domain-containing protein [Saliphagus sp. LR7]
MSRPASVSVVLPAHDEAGRLQETVGATLEALASFLPAGSFEVIVAEDGCTDRTPEIARELAAGDDRVRHVHSGERLGRGRALERAFRAADGETLVYFDCDLATDLSHLEELVESVRSGEVDVATGSRRLSGRRADRPAKRRLPSAVYNGLVRLALGSELRDHQCGFKAFDRAVLEDVLPAVEDGHWFWDTEVLVAAQGAGYRVREFPVEWTPRGDTDVDLLRDGFGMGGQLARTWWQRAVEPRIGRRSRLLAGSLLVVLAVAVLAASFDLAVIETMAGADPAVLGAATVLYACSWPVRGVRYRDILARLGHREGVGFLMAAIFVSQTGNLVAPARAGDAVRAYVLKARRAVPYPTGFASLAVERVFDLLTVLALAAVVLAGFFLTGATEGLRAAVDGAGVGDGLARSGRVAVAVAAVVAAATLAALVGIVATARSERSILREGVARLGDDAYAARIGDLLAGFAGDVQTVATDRRAFAVVGASSLVIWIVDAVVAAAVLQALGAGLPLPAVLSVCVLAVSVGNLAKVLPLTPGGIGLYEGAFTVLVVALAPVSPALALAAAVVDHAIKNLVTVVGGLGATVALDVSLSAAVEESGDVAPGDGYGSD